MKNKIHIIIANLFCIIALVGLSIYIISVWKELPDKIPIHFNAEGRIDDMSSKWSLIAVHVVNVGMFIFLSFVELCPKMWNVGVQITPTNKNKVYAICRNMILSIKAITVLGVAYMTFCMSKNMNLGSNYVFIFIGMILVTIIVHFILLHKLDKQ